ncbi:MAG: hypothetical protein OXR66_05470 [Candidatus Woesearchaeota archaeon]|nr:hypothetical protein [Candidatus Woesearchaeota archaeon]
MMYQKIITFLDEHGVEYEHFEHEHVHSSADAAKVRGTKLEEAAKALILQSKSGKIFQCIVAGHRKLDLKAIKKLIGEKNISLAHPDVVFQETGCKVGTVPPFGNLFEKPLQVYADKELLTRDHVCFSVASHNHSVRMKSADWARLTNAAVHDIGKE